MISRAYDKTIACIKGHPDEDNRANYLTKLFTALSGEIW